METLISLLIFVAIIAVVIWIAPILLTGLAILVIAVLIYGIYAKHKVKKQLDEMEQDQTYYDDHNDTGYYHSSSSSDDIIDVEYTESVDDSDD